MNRHTCVHFSWGKRLLVLLFVTILISAGSLPVHASFAGDTAFSDISWELVMKDSLANSYGTIQAFCATDEYFIIIENSSQKETTPDVVSAYYRYDHDADGNPVDQYALARRVEEFDYEHANGIAWNPHTDEVYVAPCLNNGKKSRGCIFVMDPHTLKYKETRKIYPGWLIRALDYDADAERYAVLVSKGSTWKLLLMDNDFEVISTQKAPDNSPGTYYQDICLTGDYLLTPPYTLSLGVGNFVNVHSVARSSKLYSVPINVKLKKSERIEGEAICETEPGIFMMAVNFFRKDGQRELRLYKSTVPYYFSVSVSIANGYATLASEKVLRGSDYTIDYEPYEGFQLTSIEVDGARIDHEAFEEAYTFSNVQEDHTITISYTAAGTSYAAPAAPIPTGSVEEVLSERARRVAAEAAAISPAPENADLPAAEAEVPAAYEAPTIVTALLTIGSTAEQVTTDTGATLAGMSVSARAMVSRLGRNALDLCTALLASRLFLRMLFILAGAAAVFCLVYLPYVRIERSRRHKASLRKRRALKARIEEAERELSETELSLSYLI